MLRIFYIRLVSNVLDINKHTSNMSHKANELIVAIVAKTEESYRLAVTKRQKNCALSVLRETRNNLHICYLIRASIIKILLSCLTIKGGCFVF